MIKQETVHKYILTAMGFDYRSIHDNLVCHHKGAWTLWEYFGKVLVWAQAEPFWGHFKEEVIGEDDGINGPLRWPINEMYLDPDVFIKELYDFLIAFDRR